MARNNLEGITLNVIPADWMKIELRNKEPIDYGFVGNVMGVEARPAARILRMTNFIACACLGVTPEGQICNINADTVAAQLAIEMKAHKLIFLSDVDGVQIDGKTAPVITQQEIAALIKNGTVTDGMKVKLENCFAALNGGVKRIHLISGLRLDALKKEIYESVGPGTMLFDEAERENYHNEVEAQKVIEAQMKRA